MIQQLVLNGVIAGAIYALVGLGFALVYAVGAYVAHATYADVGEASCW